MYYYKHNATMLLPIFPIAVIAKIYEYNFMGENAFILINYVLRGVNQGILTGTKSLDFPIKVLSVFEFLSLETPLTSGIFCAAIMNILVYLILVCNGKDYTLGEYIFIYLSIFILNFTVFDFNKDIIQFCILLFVYVIMASNGMKANTKIFLILMILLFESVNFREYYLLVFGLFPTIYFLLKDLTRNEYMISKKTIIAKILLIFLVFFLTIYIIQFVSPSSYYDLISRRSNLDNMDAVTIIRNLIPGEGFIAFCYNYFLNFIRCLFPLELIPKGIKYIAFAIYQFFITYNLLKGMTELNTHNILFCSFSLAYCMTLAASESDFGTFVRHQSVLVFFYLFILHDRKYNMVEDCYNGEEN